MSDNIIRLEDIKKNYENEFGAMNNLARTKAVLDVCEKEHAISGNVTADGIIKQYGGSKAVVSPLVRLFKQLQSLKATDESHAPISLMAILWQHIDQHFKQAEQAQQRHLTQTELAFLETADTLQAVIDEQRQQIEQFKADALKLSNDIDTLKQQLNDKDQVLSDVQNKFQQEQEKTSKLALDNHNKDEEIKKLCGGLEEAKVQRKTDLERQSLQFEKEREALIQQNETTSKHWLKLIDKERDNQKHLSAERIEKQKAFDAFKSDVKLQFEQVNKLLKTRQADNELKEQIKLLVKTMQLQNKKGN